MIDAQRAGVAERAVERIAKGAEVPCLQRRRRERREAPVLTGGIVVVGGRADPGAGHDQLAVRPGRRAVRRDADGKIEVEADAHAGGACARAAPSPSCRSARNCSQAWKVTRSACSSAKARSAIGRRIAVFLRPAVPGRAVPCCDHRLRQRLEQRVQVEALPRSTRKFSNSAQLSSSSRAFRGRSGTDSRAHRSSALRDGAGNRSQSPSTDQAVSSGLGQAVVTRHLVERDVERIEELAVGGKERAATLRLRQEQCVQRIDADEISAPRRRFSAKRARSSKSPMPQLRADRRP